MTMKIASETLAQLYLNGDFENLPIQTGADKIGILENSQPSFDILLEMLQSAVRSAQGAALYILYNREGPFPQEITQTLDKLSSHEDGEIRKWAKSCLD